MAGDPFGKFGNAQNKYVLLLAGRRAGSPALDYMLFWRGIPSSATQHGAADGAWVPAQPAAGSRRPSPATATHRLEESSTGAWGGFL